MQTPQLLLFAANGKSDVQTRRRHDSRAGLDNVLERDHRRDVRIFLSGVLYERGRTDRRKKKGTRTPLTPQRKTKKQTVATRASASKNCAVGRPAAPWRALSPAAAATAARGRPRPWRPGPPAVLRAPAAEIRLQGVRLVDRKPPVDRQSIHQHRPSLANYTFRRKRSVRTRAQQIYI